MAYFRSSTIVELAFFTEIGDFLGVISPSQTIAVFFAVVILATSSSCRTTQNPMQRMLARKLQKQQKDARSSAETMQDAINPMRLPMGSVHMVDPNGAFALIKSTRNFPVQEGAEIVTFSADGTETSTLIVSPVRKGEFVTADVSQGSPRVGDRAVTNYVPQQPNSDGLSSTGESGGSDIQVLE